MRIVSGTIRSTPTPWLPVLCNIAPSNIRREEATLKLWDKLTSRPDLPLHKDVIEHPSTRLPSRHPIWSIDDGVRHSLSDKWKKAWDNCDFRNKSLIQDPSRRLFGMQLKRKQWCDLNHFRTGHGMCAETEYRWGRRINPSCVCGEVQSMNHIVNDCSVGKCPDGLVALSEGDDEAIQWLNSYRHTLNK